MATGVVKNNLPNIFGSPQASRKTIDELRKYDPEQAHVQLEKSKEFAIKMMLAKAKNMDPFDESNNSSTEMLETANLIAQLDSSSVQAQEMREMAKAIKNPGFNAIQLQGKEVEYDNSKRLFDGKSAVNFDYKIDYNEEDRNGTVASTINIKDAAGKIVFTTKGRGEKGHHDFTWDGRDNDGRLLSLGSYNIEIKAQGSKMVSGQQVSFPVQTSSSLSAIVQSVDIEHGVATKLVLANGKVINKDQVTRVIDVPELESAAKLDPHLIGSRVELDLSRAQSSDGEIEVYFNNHVKTPGKTTIYVFNEKNKLVKTLEHDGNTEKGINMVSFSTDLPDNNYTVKVTVEDKDDNDKPIPLNSIANTTIVGVNYDRQTFISIEEKEFKPHNINKVAAKYTTPLQERAIEYKGTEVTYRDDKFTFHGGSPFAPEITVKKPEEADAILSHVTMTIYNENNDIVQQINGKYDALNVLNRDSITMMNQYCNAQFGTSYNNLTDENRITANKLIEERVKNSTYKIKPEFIEAFAKKEVTIKFPEWLGAFSPSVPPELGDRAQEGELLRVEFSPIYLKNDGNIYAGETSFNKPRAKVVSVDQQRGELLLNLDNNTTISEDRILSTQKIDADQE